MIGPGPVDWWVISLEAHLGHSQFEVSASLSHKLISSHRVPARQYLAMALALLEDWCRILSVDDQKSLMVMGIPVDCSEDEIQEVLQETLKPLGRYRLLGKIFRKQENASVCWRTLRSLRSPARFRARGASGKSSSRPLTRTRNFWKD